MPMSISEIYDYVFGNKAKIPALSEGTKLNPQQQEKKEARDVAAKAIKKANFNFITSNPLLSQEFRTLLRALKNTDLERLLYGNTTDVLEKTQQSLRCEMPTPETMRAQFETLNHEYGYFTETSLDTFIQLFKASKLIADFVEKNNSASNAIAYLHAYKMMVLFKTELKSPFSGINKYIGAHWNDKPKAIHDALVLAIPKNILSPKRLESWQKLIMQHGNEALSLFQEAQAIEAHLEGSMSLSAVQKAAVKIQYKQHAINPELALLCAQYHVSEKSFDKCLTINPKQKDQLPEVIVDGASLGHPGYYLVKLPIDDPRAYILGHITNCCQNIGGESEQCVIDGITREHNGFYVLLKANPKAHEHAVIDGKINYAKHKIVGQGYAWFSELDNLTFDSWDNLTPSTDDQVIVDLLAAFAEQCFEKKPSIGRITIGRGGKTPTAYAVETPYPEKIAEGFQYEDSSRQATLAMNPALLEETARINEKLKAVGVVLAFDVFSMKQIKWFESLLTETTFQYYKDTIGESTYQALLKKAARNPTHLAVIIFLHQASLLTKSTSKLVLSVHGLFEALSTLYKVNPALVNDENFKCLAQGAQYAENMVQGLSILYKTDPGLVNDENRKLLTQNAQYADNMAQGLSILYKINPALVNDENFKCLAQNAQYASNMSQALSILYKVNPALVNDENFKCLAQNAQYASNMSQVLSLLDHINDENFKCLAQNAQYAIHMSQALSLLDHINSALVNDKNFKYLAQNAQYASNMSQALSILYKASILCQADPSLVNDENFKCLAQNVRYADKMADTLSALYKISPALVNDENRKLLAQNAQYAGDMARGLYALHQSNPESLTSESFKALIASVVPRAALTTDGQLGKFGLFSSRPDGFEQVAEKKLEKDSESKESKPGQGK